MDNQKEETRGRPSKYIPEYNQQIIDLMATGLSITAFAGSIGVSRDTIYHWANTIPEFAEAKAIGEAKRVLKLEMDLLTADMGPKVTSRIFALKNACPAEWRDKHDVELSGPNGGPLEIAWTVVDPASET